MMTKESWICRPFFPRTGEERRHAFPRAPCRSVLGVRQKRRYRAGGAWQLWNELSTIINLEVKLCSIV